MKKILEIMIFLIIIISGCVNYPQETQKDMQDQNQTAGIQDISCTENADCEYRSCLGCYNKNSPQAVHKGGACFGGNRNFRDVCACQEHKCTYSQEPY